MKTNFLFFAFGLVLTGVLMLSCSNDDNVKSEAKFVIKKFPQFKELYSEHIETESGGSRNMHQNCCECSTSGCSAKKCCSGVDQGNCSCTCTSNWFQSSCSCGACSPASMVEDSYELWLTEAQYAVWDEFADILADDGTATAGQAMDALLDALEATVDDDFEAFEAAKLAMRSYCIQLPSGTKNRINAFLDLYNFEDTRL